MLEKRIAMLGHDVIITSDGQECHDRFVASGGKVDVILMDLKVFSPSTVLDCTGLWASLYLLLGVEWNANEM